jgi:hypothetical protein
VFDRLISKAGFSGTVYRWVMGLSFASFVPAVIVFGIAVIFDRERSRQNWEAIAGLFVGLCIVINWIILTVLAWWPWPSLRKLK